MFTVSVVLITALLFFMGAAVGSFLNVVVYRSVRKENWVVGWSHCDLCSNKLHWFDNIPLLSYLVLWGKTRCCKESLSLAHPVIELLTGLLFVWWYWGGALFFELTRAPFEMLQPLFWLLVGILFIMIVVADALYLIIPDITVGILLFLTILYRVGLTMFGIYQVSDLILSVVGMVLVFAFFAALWLMTKGKGMGLGDVKLVVPLTLLLGWPKMLIGMFLAFVLGAVVGLLLIVVGKRQFGQTIPFGPFLVAGTVITLIAGDHLLQWYISQL